MRSVPLVALATAFALVVGVHVATAAPRECSLRAGGQCHHHDLRGSDLRGRDLRGVRLHGSDLRESDLRGADLRGADLRGVDMRGARLRRARLSPLLRAMPGARRSHQGEPGCPPACQPVDLSRASLGGADLRSAVLDGAVMRQADLGGALMQGVSLDGADLTGANLSDANLTGAVLSRNVVVTVTPFRAFDRPPVAPAGQGDVITRPRLGGPPAATTSLRGANLANAVLDGAAARGVDFANADLDGITARSTDFGGADFQGASIRNAILTLTEAASSNLFATDIAGTTLFRVNLTKAMSGPDGWGGGAWWGEVTCPDGVVSLGAPCLTPAEFWFPNTAVPT